MILQRRSTGTSDLIMETPHTIAQLADDLRNRQDSDFGARGIGDQTHSLMFAGREGADHNVPRRIAAAAVVTAGHRSIQLSRDPLLFGNRDTSDDELLAPLRRVYKNIGGRTETMRLLTQQNFMQRAHRRDVYLSGIGETQCGVRR